MADYDITLKRLSDLYPEDFAQLIIPKEAIADATHIEDREINLLLKKVDYLYRVRSKEGESYIIHIEFQTEHKEEIPRRMFEYAGQITNKYHLPVISGVIYLKETSRDIPDSYDILIQGRLINSFRYRVIKLWEIDVSEVLGRGRRGLLALVPLMKVSRSEEVLKEAYREILEIGDTKTCREVLAGAYILSGIRYGIGLIRGIFLKEEIIMESVTYQEILERGIERGIEKGIDKGIEKGREEGREEGIQQGIIDVLEERFGGVSVGVRDRVRGIRDMGLLQRLLRETVRVGSVGEFEERLKR